MSEVKKKYELNHDRAVQDLYDIRDEALKSGSFNAAIAAQNALLKVGGLVVEKKEVRFGKIDQMSREEVENRLKQLMGEELLEIEGKSRLVLRRSPKPTRKAISIIIIYLSFLFAIKFSFKFVDN